MFSKINLSEDSVSKLFVNFSVPSVTGMVISALYAIIDGIFIGRGVGADGLAAITLAYPIINLGVALSFLFGMGGATLMSLHPKNIKFRNTCFSHLVTLNIISYLILVAITFIFNDKLMLLMGSNERLLPMVKEYLYTCVVAMIFLMLSNSLNAVVRNDKAPLYAFISMIVGAITNIVLDWVFIIKLGWGLFGGALATGIGQFLSFLILIWYFIHSKTTIKYKFEKIKLVFLINIVYIGFPSFTIEFAAAVTNTLLNKTFMEYLGGLGVAAFSIVAYICYIFRMVFSGFGQALQPIASFNYGIKLHDRVKKIFKIAHLYSFVTACLLLFIMIKYGSSIVKLFNDDKELIEVASNGLILYSVGIMFLAANFINISYLQAKGDKKISNILSILRSIIFITIAIIILPRIFGETGIWLSFPAADIMTFVASIFFYKRIIAS